MPRTASTASLSPAFRHHLLPASPGLLTPCPRLRRASPPRGRDRQPEEAQVFPASCWNLPPPLSRGHTFQVTFTPVTHT